MPTKLEEPYEFVMRDDHHVATFTSYEETADWFIEQGKASEELRKFTVDLESGYFYTTPGVQAFLNIVEAGFSEACEAGAKEGANWEYLESKFQDLQKYDVSLLPAGPEMQQALKLALILPLAGAIRVLRIFCDASPDLHFPPPNLLRGLHPDSIAIYIEAARIESGNQREIIIEHQKALQRLQSDQTKKLDDLVGAQTEILRVAAGHMEQIRDIRGMLARTIRAARNTHSEKLSEYLTEHNETLTATRRAHDAQLAKMKKIQEGKLALGRSEELWEKRYEEHTKSAGEWRLLLTNTIAAFGALLVCFIVVSITFDNPISTFDPSILLPILGAIGILMFWFLRTIGLEYKRNTTIADDAADRLAMIKTFLALEYTGDAKQEERFLILDRIFRPRSIGDEDALAHPIWDLVRDRLSGKGEK